MRWCQVIDEGMVYVCTDCVSRIDFVDGVGTVSVAKTLVGKT